MSATSSRRAGVLVAALSGAALLAIAPAVAFAHPLVDRGRAAFEQADFPGALTAVSDALRAEDLARDELAAVYELRALIRLAQGDRAGYVEDLRRLASFAPDYALSAIASPDVAEELASIRSQLEGTVDLAVEVDATPDGVTFRGRARHDVGGLARTVRIHTRVGERAWESEDDGSATVIGDPGTVRYWAELIGPGGAVIAAVGNEAEPLSPGPLPAATDPGSPTPGPPAEGDDSGVVIGVTIAVVLAVLGAAAGITAAVVIGSQPSDETRFEPPMVSFQMAMP